MSVSNFSNLPCKKLTQFLFTTAFVASLSACGGGGIESAAIDSLPDSGVESEVNTEVGQARNLVLVSQPANVVVPEGESYTFSVKVNHTHPVTVEWFKDGKMVDSSDTNSFVVDAMDNTSAGTYSCAVTDGVLTQECENFTISLSDSPSISIEEQPANQMVNEGMSVIMDVLAQGSDEYSYQWYLNGVAIDGAIQRRLEIAAVTSSDAGDYYVVVTGSGSSAQSESAELRVTATAVTAAALIQWEKPLKRADGTDLDPSEIAGYEIFHSEDENGTMEPLASLDADAQSYETPDLGEGNHYFALQTIDQSGLRSAMSDPILITVN